TLPRLCHAEAEHKLCGRLLLAIAAARLRVGTKAGADGKLRPSPSIGSSRDYSRFKDRSFVTTYVGRGAICHMPYAIFHMKYGIWHMAIRDGHAAPWRRLRIWNGLAAWRKCCVGGRRRCWW